jgi:hypothetical protein
VPASSRPIASVSLDTDDLWTYLKTRGDPTWSSYPSYLPVFIPRVLQVLEQLDLQITFFVVGRDAAQSDNVPLFRAVAERGHEMGNHSYQHDCWLHRYTAAQLDDDLARAEDAIGAATNRRPKGFRGPGFSWSTALLETLVRRGYQYDATTLPTIVGPMARAYFLRTARLTSEEREERAALFGSWREAARPLRPYLWSFGRGPTLLEIPVTTMPLLRLPFHMSYLVYLSQFSWVLMSAHLRTALGLCRLLRVEPSFLLHPLDILDTSEAPGMEFFPGMRLPVARKLAVFRYALARIRDAFDIVPLERHADLSRGGRPMRVALAPRQSADAPPRGQHQTAFDDRTPPLATARREPSFPSHTNGGAT